MLDSQCLTVKKNSQSSRSSKDTSFLDFTSTCKTNTEKSRLKTKEEIVFWCIQRIKCFNSAGSRDTFIPKTVFICNMSGISSGCSCTVSCHNRYAPPRAAEADLSAVDLWELQHTAPARTATGSIKTHLNIRALLSALLHSLLTNHGSTRVT